MDEVETNCSCVLLTKVRVFPSAPKRAGALNAQKRKRSQSKPSAVEGNETQPSR